MPDESSVRPNSGSKNFLVGRIVGFHGLKGEVKVRPATNSPEILMNIVNVRTAATPHLPATNLEVDTIEVDKKMLFLSFKGFADRTSVQVFEGADLYVDEDQLEPLEEEEFWVKDLVGMEVVTTEGRSIGKVVDIIYGGNDLLEIRSEEHPPNKSILVPFVKDLVPVVKLKERRIEVVDVPGLLEPQ